MFIKEIKTKVFDKGCFVVGEKAIVEIIDKDKNKNFTFDAYVKSFSDEVIEVVFISDMFNSTFSVIQDIVCCDDLYNAKLDKPSIKKEYDTTFVLAVYSIAIDIDNLIDKRDKKQSIKLKIKTSEGWVYVKD